jgi:hypothetical protein
VTPSGWLAARSRVHRQEVAHGSGAGAQLGHARGTECRVGSHLAQSDRGWLVQVMDLSVHHTR